jgi:hypothetical protein
MRPSASKTETKCILARRIVSASGKRRQLDFCYIWVSSSGDQLACRAAGSKLGGYRRGTKARSSAICERCAVRHQAKRISTKLVSNTTGANNTASGYQALASNTTASYNVATGFEALLNNTTGSNNTAIGASAGSHQTTGSNNIYIGNLGDPGESGVIRIGNSIQAATYIAGISNAHVTGSAVYVTSTGELGVLASSERYKTAIAPMGANTDKMQQLRPVSFHLKTDPKGTVQYGLIAEEVDKVYPEPVVRDKNGRIDGVCYAELAPMLLNEMQKEQSTVATLVAQHEADAVKLDSQAAKIASLEQQLAGIQAALIKLQPKDLVAQR